MTQAWRFVGGSPAPDPIDVDTALTLLRAPGPGPVWIDLAGPLDGVLARIDEVVGLGEFLLEDLREGTADAGQRTKLQQHGGCGRSSTPSPTATSRSPTPSTSDSTTRSARCSTMVTTVCARRRPRVRPASSSTPAGC